MRRPTYFCWDLLGTSSVSIFYQDTAGAGQGELYSQASASSYSTWVPFLGLLSQSTTKLGGFRKQKQILLTVLELAVQNQGVNRAGCIWRLWGSTCSMPISLPVVAASNLLHSLAHGCSAPIPDSVPGKPSSLCTSVWISLSFLF